MRHYVKNIILYLAALLGILCFIALFSNSLQMQDEIKGTWSFYNVNAYLGEVDGKNVIYKGAGLPIAGFVLPLVLSIVIIIESFKPEWLAKLHIINTIFGILYFICSILVLLTKELFLEANGFGQTNLIRNGTGPIFASICSLVAGILLLVVTWIPSKNEMKFIEK